MKQPKVTVSVIIPNYNHKRYLPLRINSVLEQTFQDFELILLDDCSTDGSRELLESYAGNPHVSHLVLNDRNTGYPFMQWEKGIRLAQGKYVWIAESDDYAKPEFLEHTVRQLEEHPEAQLCITGSCGVDGEGNPIKIEGTDCWEEDGKAYEFPSHEYLTSHMLAFNSVYNASMVLFRREGCLENIDPRFRQMRYCGDWLFWIEQIRKGNIIEIHRKLNCFRKHGNNTTVKGSEEGNSLGEIAYIKRSLYTKERMRKKDILQDKYNYYKVVKYYRVSSPSRRKELFRLIAREGNISYRHYRLWKLWLSYKKHIAPLFRHTN